MSIKCGYRSKVTFCFVVRSWSVLAKKIFWLKWTKHSILNFFASRFLGTLGEHQESHGSSACLISSKLKTLRGCMIHLMLFLRRLLPLAISVCSFAQCILYNSLSFISRLFLPCLFSNPKFHTRSSELVQCRLSWSISAEEVCWGASKLHSYSEVLGLFMQLRAR